MADGVYNGRFGLDADCTAGAPVTLTGAANVPMTAC
jgi:hypothetical protein